METKTISRRESQAIVNVIHNLANIVESVQKEGYGLKVLVQRLDNLVSATSDALDDTTLDACIEALFRYGNRIVPRMAF